MKKSCSIRYKELLLNSIEENGYNSKEFTVQFLSQLVECMSVCQKLDVQVCKELLAEGYNVSAIQQSLMECSYYAMLYPDEDLTSLYCDGIFETVKKDRIFQFTKTFNGVQEQYLKSISTIKYKYDNYKISEFNEVHIALTLIRQGYAPDIILKAMLVNSPNKAKGEKYFRRIMLSCKQANSRYKKIMSGRIKNDYINLANEYLIHNKMHLLNNEAEIYIITRLLMIGKTEEEIKEYLLNYSPVAVESSRMSDDIYVEKSIRKAKLIHEKNLQIESKNYSRTVERYKELVDKYNAKMELAGLKNIDLNRAFYDGRIIKDMLQQGFFENNLLKVLMEHSPKFTWNTPLSQDSSPLDYAKYILSCIMNTINRENAIKSFPYDELKYKNMESMTATGYSIDDLYKSVVCKLIKENPNVEYRMMESYIDIEGCETIFKAYPKLSKEDFIDAIAKNSPRYSMPGVPENYASNLVDKYIFSQEKEIEERKLLEKNKREHTALICQDFRQNEEFSYNDNNLTKYHSCRAALMMLQSGVPDEEVLAAISETIGQLGYENDEEADIDSFAQNVLAGAHNVRNRLNRIVMHDVNNPADMDEAGLYYLNIMNDFCKNKYDLTGVNIDSVDVTDNMDMNAIMLMKSRYSNEQIQSVIQEYSPVAAELGRDENYSKYVLSKTEQRMEQERIKLDNYICIPRYQKEQTVEQEYDYQKRQIMSEIYLPYDQRMEVLVTGVLLAEGFSHEDIFSCLEGSVLCHSPKYSEEVMSQASEMIIQQNDYDIPNLGQEKGRDKLDDGPELSLDNANGVY